jgi:hypothetical protein
VGVEYGQSFDSLVIARRGDCRQRFGCLIHVGEITGSDFPSSNRPRIIEEDYQ